MFAVGREIESDETWGAMTLPAPLPAPLRARPDVTADAPPESAAGSYGTLRVASRLLSAGDALRLDPDAEMVHIVIAVAGSIAIDGVREAGRLGMGQALMLVQPTGAVLSACQASSLLLIDVPRCALQASCFKRWGEPRRVGRVNIALPCAEVEGRLGDAVLSLTAIHIFRFRGGWQARDVVGEAIVEALVDELRERDRSDYVFPVAASIQRAFERMAEVGAEPVTDEDVVRAAGVTRLTLRRTVREITGVPLGKLLTAARLDWARARLQSNQESRSLGALAGVLGYKPVVFGRAYQRRFGETPTQTRTRAFRPVR